tara:strand:- start:1062 stop:1409 length:348 start_codon:yes stop_codon:yes gene_type:complete
MELYADHHPKTSIKGFGYANAEKARETLKKLDWKSRVKKAKDKGNGENDEIAKKVKQNPNYVIQVVITMYHRAKHHPYRTPGMEEAMVVFREYLDKYKKIKPDKKKKLKNKSKKS